MNSKYCVYLTTNKINGKTYVGQHRYRKLYDGYIGSGSYLKKAIKKYGKENFEIEYLETDLTEEEVDWYEKWYINVLNPDYNLQIGGQGARYRDTIASQERRKRLSEISKKRWQDPEYRRNQIEKHTGKPSPKKGKKLEEFCKDPDHFRKQSSESHKGNIPWNKGKKGVIVPWNKGKKTPEATRKKQSEAKLRNPTRYWKGKSFDEAHKQKLRESRKKLVDAFREYQSNGGTLGWLDWNKERKLNGK